MAELDHNTLLVKSQRGPKILLRYLDLFISALLGILLTWLLHFSPTRPSTADQVRLEVSVAAVS